MIEAKNNGLLEFFVTRVELMSYIFWLNGITITFPLAWKIKIFESAFGYILNIFFLVSSLQPKSYINCRGSSEEKSFCSFDKQKDQCYCEDLTGSCIVNFI